MHYQSTDLGYYMTSASSSATWDYWNTTSANATSTAWENWNATSAATTSYWPPDSVWAGWLRADGSLAVSVAADAPEPQPLTVETLEALHNVFERQRQEAEERERRRREEEERRQREWDEASARAEELLLSLLTDEQIADWQKHKWFYVEMPSGNRYRLHDGRAGNIDVMRDDKVKHKLCIHPVPMLPNADNLVAQLLHLQADEAWFVQSANIHTVYA